MVYVRIRFKDVDSEATRETIREFGSSPNGTYLCSVNAWDVTPYRQMINNGIKIQTMFWYLDERELIRSYPSIGIEGCVQSLGRYAGVESVEILPIEGNVWHFTTDKEHDDLRNLFMTML